jgi:signal transduction histidine kinase
MTLPRRLWIPVVAFMSAAPLVMLLLERLAECDRLERHLKDGLGRLDQTNRLRRERVGRVCHDLRSSMNAVGGWARLIHAGKLDDVTMRRGLEIIEGCVARQEALVEELFAGVAEPAFAPPDRS